MCVEVGGGHHARGCRGLGDWVRPLFCDHGVRLGLFTALSKQAMVMGVALPCLL